MENKEMRLLDILEDTQIRLLEDIQTLGYIQDEYFSFIGAKDNFMYEYSEIQNKLITLSKSMTYNANLIGKYINKIRS